jgi:hypothetical protein
MRVIFIAIAMIYSLTSLGQSAFVKKVVKEEKAYLVIGLKNEDSTDWHFANCFFRSVTILPDTMKIRLIGELLNYTSDTIMCYNPVYNLSGHYETIKREPTSKEYNLQIDALILINYIAFSSNAFIYSPYPLLYDKETGKEICCYSDGLKAVIAIYKDWFKELKQKGFNGYCYPLYDKRYEWFASKTKQQKFKEYPLWNSFYDCREIK